MNKSNFYFHLLISNETRQEFLTSATLAIILIADLFFLVVVAIFYFVTGDASGFPYFIFLGVVSGLGWYLSRIGQWQWVRHLPTSLFFLLGAFGSINVGFSTHFTTFYIIAFMLAGLLVNKYAMLLTALVSIVVHTTIAQPDYQVESLIVLAAEFTGICLLQWIYIIIADNIFRHSLLDPLTQVNNRSYFDATLEVLQKGRQYPISIVIADIDRLKQINDSHGHSTGDMMIVRASQCLRMACRIEDTLCRTGGDEFGMILTKTDENTVAEIIRRISDQVESNNQEYPEMPLHLSVGAATAKNQNQLLETLRQADKCMYDEKGNKRIC